MRQVLPHRRSCETFDFEHEGMHYTATAGSLEVFLNAAKRSTGSDAIVRDAAIAVSLALQYGAPMETLRRAMTRNMDGAPSSPIGKLLDLLEAS